MRASKIELSHIELWVREYYCDKEFSWRVSPHVVRKLLNNAISRGSAEMKWVFDTFCTDSDPNYTESIYLDYYFGRRIHSDYRIARSKFPPARAVLAHRRNDMITLRIEAENGDPYAMQWIGCFERKFHLWELGAKQGHPNCMELTCALTSNPTHDVYVSKLCFMTGKTATDIHNMKNPYLVGKEMEGYEELWEPGVHPHPNYLKAIQLYLKVKSEARRAALQAIFGLRPVLGRDVAIMIGKMVYALRGDHWSLTSSA